MKTPSIWTYDELLNTPLPDGHLNRPSQTP